MLGTKVRESSFGRKSSIWFLVAMLAQVVALIMGAAVSQPQAQEIAEAEVFFEFNSTDLDLGFDIFLDADPWVSATITAPDGVIFEVDTGQGLNEKGNTEIQTESAEPPFAEEFCADPDDCTTEEIATAIADFQSFFQEGTYTIFVEFQEGGNLSTTAELSYDLPAAPIIIKPREGSKLKKVKNINWRDTSEEGDPQIIEYEVVAEMVVLVGEEEEKTYVNTATLSGTASKFTISKEFLSMAKRAKKRDELVEFKVEVVARGGNLNKTITEVVVYEMEEEDEEEEE